MQNGETEYDDNNDIQEEYEEATSSRLDKNSVLNLNICSLNVQGLAKYVGDVHFQQYFKQYDIVGLCETWGDTNDTFSSLLDGYVILNDIRPKKRGAFRNSGGICVLIKQILIQNNFIRRIFADLNECVVLLLDGQNCVNQNDIIIIFTYIAPEKSSFYVDPTTNGIELLADKILLILSEYPNADLLIAGDLNARTKDFIDYIVEDDAVYIFGEHTAYPADEFSIHRNNKDSDFSNTYGVSLMELCCTFNVHLLNGRLFNDQDGNFTCFANNGTSVVDYMIASTALFPKFSNFGVASFDISDHLPIYCSLTLGIRPNTETLNETQRTEIHAWERYKWNPEIKDTFLLSFRENFRNFEDNFGIDEISLVSLLPDFIRVFQ